MILRGTRVKVFLDQNADAPFILDGILDADYDGTQDAVLLHRRGKPAPAIIPGFRVIYVEPTR
jgi:hypothetical protein